ncbi:MAG: polymer-forming cytoskeletal protein [Pyrinomonadaceae bacterium]
MIRMGRNSDSGETDRTGYQDQRANPETLYQYSAESSPSSRPVTDSDSMARDIKEGRLSGYVGHGTVLTGETQFQAMLRVDGHLHGTVSSDAGALIVGTNGQVDANVSVASAQINGTVNGDIHATDKVHLGRTAKVVGNVETPKLILEEGAILEGGCSMLKARETQETHEVSAKSSYSSSVSSYSTAVPDDIDASELDTDEDEESAEAVAA